MKEEPLLPLTGSQLSAQPSTFPQWLRARNTSSLVGGVLILLLLLLLPMLIGGVWLGEPGLLYGLAIGGGVDLILSVAIACAVTIRGKLDSMSMNSSLEAEPGSEVTIYDSISSHGDNNSSSLSVTTSTATGIRLLMPYGDDTPPTSGDENKEHEHLSSSPLFIASAYLSFPPLPEAVGSDEEQPEADSQGFEAK